MNTLSEIFAAPSIAAAQAEAERKIALFDEAYRTDIARWAMESDDLKFLSKIVHRRLSDRALLSNKWVHRAAQFELIDALSDAYLQEPDRQWLWCTLAWDAGVSWERAPDIDLLSLKAIANGHLRRSGLEGFGVIETDIWKNMVGEPGRRLVSHIHFIGTRAPGNHLKVTEIEAEMRDRRALTNSLGARSVVIKNVGQTVDDLTWLGQYMLKRPAFAKNPIPRNGDGYRLQDVAHARGSVARLVEVFSHCEVGDIIFSIGSGRAIAEKVRAAVRREIAPRTGASPAPTPDEAQSHWNRIRDTCGNKQFHPCRIITRADQRT
ncbi:hypothetical protein [Pelagerythrobacter rhizovicinus]|uniref:Uncharacterized protein n=1 Tax=Pelagerythrobacter rhizovicinus TaxID=2268576 RepID=A0A4Q2KM65_9SPHN|nr:hypothetical protein [Pelagerythrobacter rhizovicinus]RXZ64251.1 hypothetical protein ETX26_10080 [Pelagerythrobacter rhizovicinus]